MRSLIAKSPLSGRAGVTIGAISLAEVPLASIQSIAPLRGGEKALTKALKALGLAMPGPNTCQAKGDHLIVWTAAAQAFLIGPSPVDLPGAAATDQSDGWVRLRVEGPASADVLMRLVPLDLRAFSTGQAARAPLNHMQAIFLCVAPGQMDVLVFRSMAQTAWHEISDAAQMLAARAARPV